MVAIVAGAVVLVGGEASGFGGVGSAALVLGACAYWAVDNNLTRQVSLTGVSFLAMAKGLAAGGVNLLLAWQAGAVWPGLGVAAAAGLLGLLAYGVSLVLFVVALMVLGVWLHVIEQHGHLHIYTPLERHHAHFPDAHHRHLH